MIKIAEYELGLPELVGLGLAGIVILLLIMTVRVAGNPPEWPNRWPTKWGLWDSAFSRWQTASSSWQAG